MSSHCQPSCPSAPRELQMYHAIQAENTCTTPSNRRRYLKGLPFQQREYNKGVAALKNNKAASRDDILVEQLKHLGPKAHKWLLTMLNICFVDRMETNQDYRHMETRKGLSDSKELPTYIPLMSHVQTLQKNDMEQAGFRTDKSCTSHLLNLTQHIEDGYEEGMITNWLQTTQHTSGGAVTADSSCCASCVEPTRPQ